MKKAVKSFITMLLVVSLLMSNFAMIFSFAAIENYPVELAFNNIFVFDKWASNKLSTTIVNGGAPKSDKLDINIENGSFRFTNPYTTEAYTGHGMQTGADAAGNYQYYYMPVDPNSSYTFALNVTQTTAYIQPYVFFFNENNEYLTHVSDAFAGNGDKSAAFTTPANCYYIQIRFTIPTQGYADIKDISIRKNITGASSDINYPHRLVYSYSKSNPTTYGTLPVPNDVPGGYVFAGWFTGKDGSGEHITENTVVKHSSFTVYPKYEPVVDSISIKENAAKSAYTVGERVNLTGLVLNAKVGSTTYELNSGFYCTPEYLTTAGTQTITVHYGGKTAAYTVNVSASAPKAVVVNGTAINVDVSNNVYTLNAATGSYNYYSLRYYSDAYVRGIITYDNNESEEFFLEPSSNFSKADGNGEFSSYIDGYLNKVLAGENNMTHVTSTAKNEIKSIRFELLDNKAGTFELLSVTTSVKNPMNPILSDTDNEPHNGIMANTLKLFENEKYKVGIDILNGGVVAFLSVKDSDIVARVYNIEGKNETKVDYRDKLNAKYGTDYIGEENTDVNLINYYDTGRYLQQSYYGTTEKPYEQGFYNNADWHYNPVQGGNVAGEASKVIDYEIGEDYIYVKTRPLDWSKWSDDFANLSSTDKFDAKYGNDEYKTDTYVESRYVFEDGLIKVYNRKVDYSGLPSAQTNQELPAFYTIEPLNQYVYNASEADKWKTDAQLTYISEPEFWGITDQSYLDAHYNGQHPTVHQNTPEHWAAFMASQDTDSFGIGLYSPEVTDFYYGIYPAIHSGLPTRHAETNNPAKEDNSSYIAPLEVRTFESFVPTEYSYYISTGTANQIRNSFGVVDDEEFAAELEELQTKGMVVVPETVYMTPSTGASTSGQYYVNNIIDTSDNSVSAEAKNNNTNGYVQLYVPGAESVTYTVNYSTGTNVGDVKATGEGTTHKFNSDGYLALNTTTISVTTGLTATQTSTAEWKFTVTMKNGTTRTYYAYTTLYSPWYYPVGAATRAQTGKNGSKVYTQSIAWVSGVHGYTANSSGKYWVAVTNETINDEGEYSNKGTYFAKTSANAMVPLIYGVGTVNGTGSAVNGWISSSASSSTLDKATFRYFDLTADSGKYGCLVADISPVANITIDTSRYTNLNQIPNLTVGYNITDIDNATGVYWYVSDFTDTAHKYTKANNGTNNFYNYTKQDSADNITDKEASWFNSTSVGAVIYGSAASSSGYNSPSGGVEYNSAWNRSVISGASTYDYMFKGAAHGFANKGRAYSINYVQLRAANVNKSALRGLVVQGASLVPENYTEASWNNYYTQLKDAAQRLGNPTNTNTDTAKLQDAYNKLVPREYTITFDNLIDFSQWHTASAGNGVISNVNTATGSLTLTSNAGVGEATTTSPLFPVTAGESYTVDIDFEGTNWDVYIFFYDDSMQSGTGIDFADGPARRFSSSGVGTFDSETDKPYFTAPAGATRAVIRLDANGSSNAVTFKNIKVYPKDKTPHIMGSSYENAVTVNATQPYQTLLPTPTREGYIFEGWYIEKSGFVSNMLDAYYFGKDMVFYSSWKGIDYTVKLDGNGLAYSDTYAAEYATKIQLPNLTDYAGHTFKGWSTDKNATTATYAPGQTVSGLSTTNGDTVILYAVWAENSYTVKFNANGGSGSIADKTQKYSASIILPSSGFTRTGYTLLGWSTNASATTAEYALGATVKNLATSGTVTLYAVWSENSYTVKYNANGGSGSIADKTAKYSESFALAATGFTRTGYTFLGWSTNVSATTPDYALGATVSKLATSGTVTLYAVWSENSYTVKFDTGDANVTVANKTLKHTQSITMPSAERENYTLLGWATTKDSTEVKYKAGQSVSGQEISSIATSGTVTLYAVWKENINIVDDTIVIDFGLPVDINVLDNDTTSANGSITGIKAADGNVTTGELELSYGTAVLNGQSIIYTPSSTNMPDEDTFFYVYTANGKEYTAKVTVVPATTIYYEESFMSFTNKGNYTWVDAKDDENTDIKNIFQADNRPGEDSAYGNDAVYNDSTKYSLGTAKKTTVDSKSVGSEPEAKFTFSGTGFDLYSVTSNETGAIRVQIFKAGTTEKVKDYLVNTYYGYTGTGDGLTPDADSTAALYQVPVISTSELTYGTYDVVIKPIYTYIFDPDYKTDDGYSIYVDSVRIFNPAGVEHAPDSTIGDVYLTDGEYKPTYQTIRSVLLSSLDNVNVTGTNGAFYLDGTTQSIEAYAKQGPKNEVYLAKGQAIAFMLSADDIASLATLNIGAKVIDGGTGSISVAHGTNSLINISINGATEQFYGLNAAVSWINAGTGETTYPVVITNTSDTVISLTSFRWGHKASEASAVSFMVYPDTAMLAMRAMRSIMESAEITEESVTVEWGNDSFIAGEIATLYVTTPESIMSVWVDGVDMEEIVAENGSKLWSYEIELTNEGENTFTVDFLTDFFDPVLTLTETILVEAAPVEEETTEEETTETILPDEETTENVEADEENDEEDNSITGSLKNMLDLIFRFFRSIIELLRGLAK